MTHYIVRKLSLAFCILTALSYSSYLMAGNDHTHYDSTLSQSLNIKDAGTSDEMATAHSKTPSQISDEISPTNAPNDQDGKLPLWPIFIWLIGVLGTFAMVYLKIRTISYKPVSRNHADEKYTKIGGWLILVAISLLFTPLLSLYETLHEITTFLKNYELDIFLFPFRLLKTLDPVILPLVFIYILFIVSLLFLMIAVLILPYYLAYLLLTKQKRFVNFFIVAHIIWLNLNILCFIYYNYNLEQSDIDLNLLAIDAAIAIANATIWIPYMLRSKRVKAIYG